MRDGTDRVEQDALCRVAVGPWAQGGGILAGGWGCAAGLCHGLVPESYSLPLEDN